MKKSLYLSLVVSTMLLASSDAELSTLKDQVTKQQVMMDKLLSKIEKLEQKPTAIKQEKVTKDTRTSSPFKKKAKTFFQAAYMPDISLIGDVSFVGRSVSDDVVSGLELPGVAHAIMGSHDHEGDSHSPYNADRGFNLNYAELGLSKSVDQTFKLDAIFHLSESAFEIEELFATANLGYGLRVKGGKFNSDFTYHNSQHHHAWDFADNSLVNEAFLGMHGINETGLQVQWTAPTDTYFMIGGEVLQGENEQMFGNKAIHIHELNDAVYAEADNLDKADAPSLFLGYIKSSIDIGDTTILGGLSYAKGKTRLDHSDEEEDADKHVLAGKSELYGVDLVVKHYFDSYSGLSWESQYLQRKIEGDLYQFDGTKSKTVKEQAGIYSQLVYTVNKSWKLGARYDSIFKNTINGTDGIDDFKKYSAMIEYNTSEFTKLRLQYNQNRALYAHDEATDTHNLRKVNSVILQANFAIGAHGAHSF